MAKSKFKMSVVLEPGTNWITVKCANLCRNGYPKECVDNFGDVWLKPFHHASNLYVIAQGPCDLYFHVTDGCLEEN